MLILDPMKMESGNRRGKKKLSFKVTFIWTQKQMPRQSSLSERQFTWPMRQFVKDSEFVVKYK